MKFGKYSTLEGTVRYKFKKEPKWYWDFKVPTWNEELLRSRIWVDPIKQEDGTLLPANPSLADVAAKELWLTFVGSNIPGKEGPLFPEGLDEEKFKAILPNLPPEMIWEVWEYLRQEVAPFWSPAWVRPREEPKNP